MPIASTHRSERLLPLHDVEIGHAAMAGDCLGITADGRGLGKQAKMQPVIEEQRHVGAQGTVPVLDPDAAPGDPNRPLMVDLQGFRGGRLLTTHWIKPQHEVESVRPMRPYSSQERAKVTAGAIAAVVATGMLFAIAMALLWAP
jgi:hypothetical protein